MAASNSAPVAVLIFSFAPGFIATAGEGAVAAFVFSALGVVVELFWEFWFVQAPNTTIAVKRRRMMLSTLDLDMKAPFRS